MNDLAQQQSPESINDSGPQLPWLALGFLLAGLGTALLGPILPFVAQKWHLTDAASGALFLAKFIGAFLGGISVPRKLRLGILSGALIAAIGFGGFAFAPNPMIGNLTLLLGGFGLGQIIASTNILAGRRYREHTGSALASLNFFWSLGAVTTGLLAASLVPKFGLRNPLVWLASLFVLIGAGGFVASKPAPAIAVEQQTAPRALPLPSLALFASLLFLYGGLETCLTSWLTTFSLRFSDAQLLHGQSAVVLFWAALTGGRLLATGLLRVISERALQAASMALGAACIATLALAHRGAMISLDCILTGIALAPFFPSTFALLMRQNPPARTAGFILAVSGLGAAFFPWLMGLISTAAGSLRLAMVVPIALAAIMLVLSRLRHASPLAGQSPLT